MAALPEDDAPTMTGTPGDRRVALPAPIEDSDGDDTTTAEAGPPASRPDVPDQEPETDAEDRTVQQQVSPPGGARKPGPAPPNGTSSPAAPRTQRGTSSSTAAPSTAPSAAPSSPARAAPPKVTEGSVSASIDLTDELTEDDEIEDSITATAPRIDPGILPHDSVELAGRGLPLSIPGSVEIRTVEHDELLDETEVRTRPGHVPLTGPATLRGSPAPPAAMPPRAPAPRPAAGRPPSMTPQTEVDDDRDDDGVTTEAPAPRVGSVPDLGIEIPASVERSTANAPRASATNIADEPPTRPGLDGVGESATRPRPAESPASARASEPETSKRIDVGDSYANEDDEDESVTTRGRAVEAPYADESVTSRAPAVPKSVVDAALERRDGMHDDASLDDGTDGTTQKVKKSRDAALSSPADGEAESITTQAPGPLTNILRVIASGSSPEMVAALPRLEDDEPPENRTAVMVNAPLKRIASEGPSAAAPSVRPAGGTFTHGPQSAAAPQLEPSSESGLRVARAGSGSGERMSLGALGAGDGRNSGVGPIGNALASDGSVSSPMDIRGHAGAEVPFPPAQQPSLHDVDLKVPRYGLLVGIVAVISVIVPVTLFFVLRHGSETVAPGVPSEPASEIQKHDGARAKGTRGKNGAFVPVPTAAAPSASASAAAPSAAPSTRPAPGQRGGFPFRR